MNPLIAIELTKQLFKFGGSFRKEAIGAGTLAPAIISIMNTYSEAQTWQAVSADQWSFFAGSIIALTVHLAAKNNEAKGVE